MPKTRLSVTWLGIAPDLPESKLSRESWASAAILAGATVALCLEMSAFEALLSCREIPTVTLVESRMGAVAWGLRPAPRFPSHRVTGGGRPPPVPTERGVRISRTTLFGS